MGGLALALVSITLFLLAWALFEQGQPGAPAFADSRADYGLDSGVVIYLPEAEPVRSTSVSAEYRHDPAAEDQTIQRVTIDVTRSDDSRDEPFFAMLELKDGARMNTVRYQAPDSPPAEVHELPDRQLIVIRLDHSGDGAVSGVMRIPALSTENSRTNFVSPRIGDAYRCDFLPAGPATTPPQVPVARWLSGDPIPCGPSAAIPHAGGVEIVDLYRIAPRLDYVVPRPLDESGSLKWHVDDAGEGLKVRASYVDINREAVVQRLMFLSGVIVGLAAGCAPYAMELMVGGFSRGTESSQRPSPGRRAAPDSHRRAPRSALSLGLRRPPYRLGVRGGPTRPRPPRSR